MSTTMDGGGPEKPSQPEPAKPPGTLFTEKSAVDSSHRPPSPPPTDIVNISRTGDLVLVISCGGKDVAPVSYRVDSELLKRSSRYFSRLLHPDRFREGVVFREATARLESRQLDPSSLPAHMLPRIELHEIGLASPGRGLENIVGDFFRVLHDTMRWKVQSDGKVQLSMPRLASMAVLADRLDCIPAVARYFNGSPSLLHKVDLKEKGRVAYSIAEERVRQKILVGWYFNESEWFRTNSKKLVLGGSIQWVGDGKVKDADEKGIWWDLPSGLEDELRYRRECILSTLNSLQLHFLKLYTSKQRQCKLGYDSSPQCDSFQLGEAIRFFMRIGALRLQGLIFGLDQDGNDSGGGIAVERQLTGDVEHLISIMKQAPSYQIDSNHRHCGIRTRLIPALEHIEALLPASGLCLRCWTGDRSGYAWSLKEKSGEGVYRYPASSPPSASAGFPLGNDIAGKAEKKDGSDCAVSAFHRLAWGLFTAAEIDQTPEYWEQNNLHIREAMK